jgi:hypothetical protein
MKTLTAYQCEHCKKLLVSKSGMGKHEKNCYHNPAVQACITCQHLTEQAFLRGRKLTEEECKILSYEVPEALHLVSGDYLDYLMLNDEYVYLNGAEYERYCPKLDAKLPKLRNKCALHQIKQDATEKISS